jgi:DNA-binding transcriptional ArsR family regulator
MTHRISGTELRDRLLSRMKLSAEPKPTEETIIQVLSSAGNRDLLEIIVTKQPHSIGELATLAGRLQPNVSRSLTALARAGLITVAVEGRASVPTLTAEGRQKAEALGFVEQACLSSSTRSQALAEDGRILAATIAEPSADSASDVVQANLTLRFPLREGQRRVSVHASINLTDICKTLLANWWRIVCRRGDPFKMFPVQKDEADGGSKAILLAESTGHMVLCVRSTLDDADAWGFPRLSLTGDEFTRIVLDDLVRPLVSRLRASKHFDHPVESLLRRTEEILHTRADLEFWQTAGALGLSYPTMSESAASGVTNLIDAISNEDARIDLASANSPDQVGESLSWIKQEVAAKAKANSLPKLIELKHDTEAAAGSRPYYVGTERARDVRRQLKLSPDRPVGGIVGLATMFGGDSKFMLSPAGEELLRGHQGHSADVPVVVVKDEGPKSTAFLISRAIGDYSVFGSREASIVDIYSDRQAVGRAFAAEFMAPAEGVVRMAGEEGVALDTVAAHYGVNREVVRRQYENNVALFLGAA